MRISFKFLLAIVAIALISVLLLETRLVGQSGLSGGGPICRLSDAARRGKIWAPTCKGCHDIAPQEPEESRGGPNLQNVYMRLAGTGPRIAGQHYFPPLIAARNAGLVWTDQYLAEYLKNPKRFLDAVTGKSFNHAYYMNFFIGQERPRMDVVAYLRAIKGHPECD